MKQKILITGIGQANFLNQLFEKLKIYDITTDAVNLKYHSQKQEEKSKEIFDELINYQFSFRLTDLVFLVFNKYFLSLLFLMFIDMGRFSFKLIGSFFIKHLKHYRYAKYLNTKKYSIINHHFLNDGNSLYLLYLNSRFQPKIMISFWGSDLFRTSTASDNYIKRSILNKTSAITVATAEMKFIICAKYGFHHFDKIFINKFINSKDYFENFDKIALSMSVEERKQRVLGISRQKIVIAFGHSATKDDNYDEFLLQLEKCDLESLNRLHFLITLTYGPDKEYLSKTIREKLNNLNVTHTILEEFLDYDTLVSYKACVDVFIFAPISDALSGNLTEYFYQEIPVFAGGWLPYKEFMNMGINFYRFDTFSELPVILRNVDNYINRDYSENKIKITKNFIQVDEEVKKWKNVFLKLKQ